MPKGVIKSANKNQSDDIKINGKREQILVNDSGKVTISANVLVANDIANNLLSLSKFAEAG